MKRCAFLSMDSLANFECYDQLVIRPLAQLGWHAEEISWKTVDSDWDQYDLVVIRSPWDYQDDFEAFLKVLESIEQSSAVLANPIDIVHWNIHKKYLAELESKGINIVPTLWRSSINANEFDDFFKYFSSNEIIIKPCISANADDTYRLTKETIVNLSDHLVEIFKNKESMIQPFMHTIVNEGEFSLFYFNNTYSHAILKTPSKGDFRVQEEHGGQIQKIEPDAALTEQAVDTLSAIDAELLYARLDFVRTRSGYALMEAELIEPSLYFNLDDESAERFAKAIVQKML
ncbi:MAG: hypothetical protein GY808_12520 [Gammaproteobacteria bacterium]|nr:hypothetical protein [Gammaproteobacteria bacterium]